MVKDSNLEDGVVNFVLTDVAVLGTDETWKPRLPKHVNKIERAVEFDTYSACLMNFNNGPGSSDAKRRTPIAIIDVRRRRIFGFRGNREVLVFGRGPRRRVPRNAGHRGFKIFKTT